MIQKNKRTHHPAQPEGQYAFHFYRRTDRCVARFNNYVQHVYKSSFHAKLHKPFYLLKAGTGTEGIMPLTDG
jgi:hypothetical protein